MYLDEIAQRIRGYVPENRIPAGEAESLFRIYAVLVRAKGASVTDSDVHDAWSAWIVERDQQHVSLVPYNKLDSSVQFEDQIFTNALRRAANEFGGAAPSTFLEMLFPSGPPKDPTEHQQVLELYKIMVESSEQLVSRRQAVNTFFLTINGALLTVSGLIVQSSSSEKLGASGVLVLAIGGAILCSAWCSLITSFGQLNRGKFKVINTIERYLKAAIYSSEWEALGRGMDPKIYRSFTSREMWVPIALLIFHILTALVSSFVIFGWLKLKS